MRESAFAREWVEEGSLTTRREDIQSILVDRFGESAAEPIVAPLAAITSREELKRLVKIAYRCPTLEEFEAALPPRSPIP